MRCILAIACGAMIAVACGHRETARQPDTPIVQTMEQYEASLPYDPVRDSTDAAARVLRELSGRGVRDTVRLTSVKRDSAGYLVTFETHGPRGVTKGLRMMVTYRGAIYEVVDLR